MEPNKGFPEAHKLHGLESVIVGPSNRLLNGEAAVECG